MHGFVLLFFLWLWFVYSSDQSIHPFAEDICLDGKTIISLNHFKTQLRTFSSKNFSFIWDSGSAARARKLVCRSWVLHHFAQPFPAVPEWRTEPVPYPPEPLASAAVLIVGSRGLFDRGAEELAPLKSLKDLSSSPSLKREWSLNLRETKDFSSFLRSLYFFGTPFPASWLHF